MTKGDYIVAGLLGCVPVLGAVTTIALEKVVTKHGHSFMQMGPKNVLLLGAIGAIQNSAALIFSLLLNPFINDDEERPVITLLAGSAIAAGVVVGLTALAAKVNLISARLSLFAGGVLIVTSLTENMMTLMTAGILAELTESS